MKRIYRQLLLFTSTVVFLALAPLVILYAMGYRTVTSNVDPLPVGVVLVETYPRRATVVMNARELGKTPRAIPNVPAGNVHIQITKEGYISWQKNVPVNPGLITELRGIRLFAEQPELQVLGEGATLLALSPNRQLIAAYFQDGYIRFLDPEGQLLTGAIKTRAAPEALLWAPNNTNLLLRAANGTVDLIDITAANPLPRPLPALQGAHEILWDPRIPGRVLVHTSQEQLRVYNITTRTSSLIATNVQQFATSARQIYVVDNEGAIIIYNLQGGIVQTLPLKLSGPLQQLLVTPQGDVAFLLGNHTLSLLRDNEIVEISSQVVTAAWSPDGRMLLVQTDPMTLYVYNELDERAVVPLHELHLVIRLSRSINHVQWFAGGQHIFYQVADELIITEIDTRDHPLEHRVDTTNTGNAQAAVGEDGEAVIYLKRSGEDSRLVTMPLIIN
ncbi:MAG: PEGA domain-containing protein [Candidatus Andersenbacteria bacterium]